MCVCVFTEREGERELLIDLLLGTYVIMEAEKFRRRRIDNIVPFQGRRRLMSQFEDSQVESEVSLNRFALLRSLVHWLRLLCIGDNTLLYSVY